METNSKYVPTFKYNSWSQTFRHPFKAGSEMINNWCHPRETSEALKKGLEEKTNPGTVKSGKASRDSFQQRIHNDYEYNLHGYNPMEPQDTVSLSFLS